MGIFRFFLAMLVFMNHIPGHVSQIDFANSAVVGFYFISGLLVSKSMAEFSKAYSKPMAIGHFYLDRIIRLWPLFFVSIAMIVGWKMAFEHFVLLNRQNLETILMNLAVFPLAYIIPLEREVFPVSILFPTSVESLKMLNGVTWSLGVEFIFYLLLPFFFLTGKRIKIGMCLIFVALHIFCFYLEKQTVYYQTYYYVGFDNLRPASLLYGYFYPLTSMAPFLLGAVYSLVKERWPVMVAYVGYVLVLFVFGQAGSAVSNAGVFEILVGVLLFVPIAILLADYKFQSPFLKKLNYHLGNFSYPIFIVHVFAIDVALKIFTSNTIYRFLCAYAVAALLCPLLVLLQSRVDKLRYRLRGFGRTRDLVEKAERDAAARAPKAVQAVQIAEPAVREISVQSEPTGMVNPI